MRNIVNKVDKISKLPEFMDPNFDLRWFFYKFSNNRVRKVKNQKNVYFHKNQAKNDIFDKNGFKMLFLPQTSHQHKFWTKWRLKCYSYKNWALIVNFWLIGPRTSFLQKVGFYAILVNTWTKTNDKLTNGLIWSFSRLLGLSGPFLCVIGPVYYLYVYWASLTH